jgi:hypothetical protein
MPDLNQGEQYWQIIRKWRGLKMLIHHARTGEQPRESIPAKRKRE